MTHASKPRRERRSRLLVSAAFAGVLASASGQEAGNVTINAQRCLEIESPAERLACFESEVRTAPASPAVPPRTVDAGAAPAQAAPAAAATAAPAESTSVGNITSVQAREPNRYLITLDNGEVWEQRVAERSPRPLVGQRVRIEPSQWGVHRRLYIEGLNGFLQVSRVR